MLSNASISEALPHTRALWFGRLKAVVVGRLENSKELKIDFKRSIKQISDEFHKVACSQRERIIDMQSTSLCTVQHGRKRFSRACILAFVWRYQGYCFSPRGLWIVGGGHFYELFSILRWLHKTCNESVYEQLHKSNVRKWTSLIRFKECLETVGWELFVWSESSTPVVSNDREKWSSCSVNLTLRGSLVIYFFIINCID